jgi:hypothetical protein
MTIRIHGIIQFWDGGTKKVQVLISREHPDIKELIDLDDDMTVGEAEILAAIDRKITKGLDRVEIPHHIRPVDAKGKQ